jgi:hypothetical protein
MGFHRSLVDVLYEEFQGVATAGPVDIQHDASLVIDLDDRAVSMGLQECSGVLAGRVNPGPLDLFAHPERTLTHGSLSVSSSVTRRKKPRTDCSDGGS